MQKFSIDESGGKYIQTARGWQPLQADEQGKIYYEAANGMRQLNDADTKNLSQRIDSMMPGEEVPEIEQPTNMESVWEGLKRQSERMTTGVQDVGMALGNVAKGAMEGNFNPFETQHGENREAIARYNADRDAEMAKHYKENPIASTIGQAAYFGPLSALPVSKAPMVTSALTTGLADYGSTPQEDLLYGMAGAKAGEMLGPIIDKGVNRVSQGIENAARPRNLQGFEEGALEAGYKLTPAEMKEGRALKGLESAMQSYPFTSGPLNKHNISNQELFNKQFADEVGIPVIRGKVRLDSNTINDAFDKNSEGYEAALGEGRIAVNQDFVDKLEEIRNRDLDLPVKSPDVKQIVDDTFKLFGGKVTDAGDLDYSSALKPLSAKRYQAIRSNLVSKNKLIKNSTTISQPGYSEAVGDLVQQLDDMAIMQLPKGDQLRRLNREYRLLRTATDGVSPALDTTTGILSASKLRNKLMKGDKKGYQRGLDDSQLYEGAKFMTAHPDPYGNSGTAERMALQALIAQGSGIAGGVVGGDFGSAGATTLAATALPYLGAKAYMSKANPILSRGRYLPKADRAVQRAGTAFGLGGDPYEDLQRLLNEEQE